MTSRVGSTIRFIRRRSSGPGYPLCSRCGGRMLVAGVSSVTTVAAYCLSCDGSGVPTDWQAHFHAERKVRLGAEARLRQLYAAALVALFGVVLLYSLAGWPVGKGSVQCPDSGLSDCSHSGKCRVSTTEQTPADSHLSDCSHCGK